MSHNFVSHAHRRNYRRQQFTDAERARILELAREGYGPKTVAGIVKKPADAVGVLMRANGFGRQSREDGNHKPVTLPRLKCLEDTQ